MNYCQYYYDYGMENEEAMNKHSCDDNDTCVDAEGIMSVS